MYTTRANHKKMEKSFNDLRAYIEEKFNDINKKYDELKATVINDTIERFQEVLKEEMSKINDKLEGKIHQLCQDKSFLQEQISELKKQNSAIAASCEETEQYSRRLCLRIDGVNCLETSSNCSCLVYHQRRHFSSFKFTRKPNMCQEELSHKCSLTVVFK